MKKIKLILLLMVVMLSGCTTQKRLEKNYEKLILDIQSTNYFDAEKFSMSGNACIGEDLLCQLFPDSSFGIKYVPEVEYRNSEGDRDFSSEYNFLFLSSMGANKKEFDNISVSTIYLQKYIYNDYIFDESQGNKLIDFFKKLDENNIHYYIHANTNIDEGYIFDEDKEWKMENQSVYCDVNKYHTDKEIKEYLGNQNLEELDMLKYIDYLNCDTQLRISFDPENLKAEGVTLEEIEDYSKEYYNPEHLSLDIRNLVYTDDSDEPKIWYMDSKTEYSIPNKKALHQLRVLRNTTGINRIREKSFSLYIINKYAQSNDIPSSNEGVYINSINEKTDVDDLDNPGYRDGYKGYFGDHMTGHLDEQLSGLYAPYSWEEYEKNKINTITNGRHA